MTKRWWIGGLAAALFGLAAAAPAIESVLRNTNADAPIVADEPAPPVRAPASRAATPMNQRVATLGLLNKRNGLSRDLKMKPGDAVHIGDAVIRMKACDQTEPWERDQQTAAFVQLIVKNAAGEKWRKVFSGWLFKESPSLNVVEHPVYDVWVKDCAMRHPEVGPNTVVLSGEDAGTTSRSKAAKSPSSDPADSALSSNTM